MAVNGHIFVFWLGTPCGLVLTFLSRCSFHVYTHTNHFYTEHGGSILRRSLHIHLEDHTVRQFRLCLLRSNIKALIPESYSKLYTLDRLCGLVVRVSGYRYRGLGFDSRRYQIY